MPLLRYRSLEAQAILGAVLYGKYDSFVWYSSGGNHGIMLSAGMSVLHLRHASERTHLCAGSRHSNDIVAVVSCLST